MPQFEEVLSTTSKVLLALFVIAAALGLGFLLMVSIGSAVSGGDSDAACQRDPACREARQNVDRLVADQKAEWEGRIHQLYIEKIYSRDGDSAGQLYEHCESEPPKQPSSQKRCKALLDRLGKEDQREDAAAKAKANW